MKTAVVIPHYNNPETVLGVAAACRRQLDDVLVVDDASTRLPPDFEASLADLGVALLKRPKNGGQGAAILDGAAHFDGLGFDYILTPDADGQHVPEDIPAFVDIIEAEGQQGDLVIVGLRDFSVPNVPGSSVFGRKFSNFWVRLESGVHCQDTQSGFRAYPVRALLKSGCSCRRYTFVVESLVRLLWGGIRLRELPIRTIYQPKERYVSHFRPFVDNLRFALLHTWLVCRQLLPWPKKRLAPRPPREPSLFWKPHLFFRQLMRENATPEMLGVSAGVSTFLAVLPLLACHTVVILYTCIRLKLNKVMALAIQHLYMPPLTVFVCIELGFYMRHGAFLREASMQTVVREMHLRLLDWLLGSLVLAPLLALVAGLATCAIARRIQRAHA